MKKNKTSKSVLLLFSGLVLGLGWAIRGVFGHWWGASWAGGMGALAVLVMAGRKDWLARLPVLAALGAIGWGVGGIMSYGVVIGYCRSTDLLNSAYGYAMLAVIGGLYGFIGGGLFGLGLESTEEHKPDWPRLLVEMSVIGLLAYWFLITELEWNMTPPRSEDWALCLGASVALVWYAVRNAYLRALRVAAYAALGAGFGFASGNFIQTMGTISGVAYNWWNVMEFSLGFCGGIGMTYGVMTTTWPESVGLSKAQNWTALVVLVLVIPFINLVQQFSSEKLLKSAEDLGLSEPERYASSQQWFAWIIMLVFAGVIIFLWQHYRSREALLFQKGAPVILFAYSLYYMLFGYLKHGFFYTGFRLERTETLYWFILPLMVLLWYLNRDRLPVFPEMPRPEDTWRRWALLLGILLVLIMVLALISTGSHEELKGAQERF